MWWNVLIIPNGYRYKVMLGEGKFDVMVDEYKAIERRAKIKFACEKGINPEKLSYNDRGLERELKSEISQGKKIFSDKYKVDLVPNQILGMIKTTEPENLDIIVKLDVEDQNEFGRTYSGDEQGALDIINDAQEIMLTHSNWNSVKKALQQDHRYRRLSDEGKKQALQRAEQESRMKDADKIREWMDRLQASIDIKNKRAKPSEDVYASVFDGLK